MARGKEDASSQRNRRNNSALTERPYGTGEREGVMTDRWEVSMHHTVSCRSGLFAVAATVAALLVWPVAGEAQLGDLSGTISGTTSTVTGTTGGLTGGGLPGTLLGLTTVLGDTGTLTAGSTDALGTASDAVSVASLLTGEVAQATTIGSPDQIDSQASLAALALNIAGITILADSILAQAMAVVGGSSGSSDISNLSINGVPISVSGIPNQAIDIPGGVVILNEQQVSPDGTLVVNALHAIVSGVADVVVASAMAGIDGGQAKAVQASH